MTEESWSPDQEVSDILCCIRFSVDLQNRSMTPDTLGMDHGSAWVMRDGLDAMVDPERGPERPVEAEDLQWLYPQMLDPIELLLPPNMPDIDALDPEEL